MLSVKTFSNQERPRQQILAITLVSAEQFGIALFPMTMEVEGMKHVGWKQPKAVSSSYCQYSSAGELSSVALSSFIADLLFRKHMLSGTFSERNKGVSQICF